MDVKRIAFLSLTASLFLASLAQADTITAVLNDASLMGAPGDTLQFFVTLSNPSATDTIFLNGISSTAASAFLSIDTSLFDANAPLFLNPSDVSGPFELFDVTIQPGTPAGPYVGNFVSIQGGADGGASTAFDDLVDVNFDVNVTGGVGSVPEPSTVSMIGMVTLALAVARWRRR